MGASSFWRHDILIRLHIINASTKVKFFQIIKYYKKMFIIVFSQEHIYRVPNDSYRLWANLHLEGHV